MACPVSAIGASRQGSEPDWPPTAAARTGPPMGGVRVTRMNGKNSKDSKDSRDWDGWD